jgi:uncharacterized membrane-anchored protein YitT (DUF2179 family)
MINAVAELVFVSKLVPVVVMVVKVFLENAQAIQMMLNVAIIFLAMLMEKVEIVFLVVNVVGKVLADYVQGVMISNVVLGKQKQMIHQVHQVHRHQMLNTMGHAAEGGSLH